MRSVRHRIAGFPTRLSDSGEITSNELTMIDWRSVDLLAGIGRHNGPLDSNLSRAAIKAVPRHLPIDQVVAGWVDHPDRCDHVSHIQPLQWPNDAGAVITAKTNAMPIPALVRSPAKSVDFSRPSE